MRLSPVGHVQLAARPQEPPDVRQRLQDLAATPEPGTPDQLRKLIASETKRWRDVVKQSGAKAE